MANSYVGRDFITAIAVRDRGSFFRGALLYLVVFAVSTAVAVYARFAEERLALLWREWLTRRLANTYLHHRVYYRLRERGEILNPDQRIAEDTRVFTATTIAFFLMVLNGSFTIIAFSGVMWSISPPLFGVALFYAAGGSVLTILFGRPLIWLNYSQLDNEAALRSDLIRVRENAESIALLHREARMSARVQRRIDELTANMRRIIAVNRNLGFFTTGYTYLIQIIPALIIAPMYMRGEVEFGVITQSAMAFSTILGAFSLIVTQFQSISSYAAVLARLMALGEATEYSLEKPEIEIRRGEQFAYEGLTLSSPRDGRTLVRELELAIPPGRRLLVTGPNETAKVALLRVTAGIWRWGKGRFVRPGHEQLQFLPERPYLPAGTLREVLVRVASERMISDDEVYATLRLLDVEVVATRAGGLHVERDWGNILGLGEQQLLVIARVLLARPTFVFLDHMGTALTNQQRERVLDLFWERSITYVAIGANDEPLDRYDAVLVIENDGAWRCEFLEKAEIASGGADPGIEDI